MGVTQRLFRESERCMKYPTRKLIFLLLVLAVVCGLIAPSTLAAYESGDYNSSAIECQVEELEAEKAAAAEEAEQEYIDMLGEAGVAIDQARPGIMTFSSKLPKLAENGDFLGYITISLERFTLGNGYVVEPISYPLYAGDTIADVVRYVSGYQSRNLISVGGNGNYTSTGTLESNFALTGFMEKSGVPADVLPADIKNAVIAMDGSITQRQTGSWLKNGDYFSQGKWSFWFNNQYMPEADLTEYSSAANMQTLNAGDVIRFQYSVTGDGRDLGVGVNKLYNTADKDDLTAKVAQVNSYRRDLLTDAGYKNAYDAAVAVLSNLKATQQQVDEALLALMNEPAVDLHGVPITNAKNLLMGNIEGKVRVGKEFELVTLDIPRTGGSDNYMRGDMTFQVVQGKDIVSIRRDLGSTSGATGNSKMKDGYAFYVKGLKQGVAILKASYPTYDGYETYIAIHVSNRDEDYNNPADMSTNLDYVTKYDTIHYEETVPYYSSYVEAKNGWTSKLYVNGTLIPLSSNDSYSFRKDGELYKRYNVDIPLKNGYNTVLLTTSSGGIVQTRVYQIRASKTTVKIENNTRPGSKDIYEGDELAITFSGMVNPLPKISTLYNPSQGQIYYTTDLPYLTKLLGSTSQYDVTTSTLTFTATGAGAYSLYDGCLRVVGFGGSGWIETPVSQILEYRGRPSVTVGGGGPNVPQTTNFYSFLPDVHFTVLENPEYTPVRMEATTDKEIYAPGETVTISIPDLDIAELHAHHDFWAPIIDDSTTDPSNEYFRATAITQASVVYASDIPGLEEVRSVEFVDVKKIIDNIRLGTPITGSDGNEITVINNYSEGAPIESLNALKTLTFKIPENTPSGTYNLKGGYVDVEFGPYWWVKYASYFGGEIEDVSITVAGEVAHEDENDGALKELNFTTSSAMHDPKNPPNILNTALSVDEAYIKANGPVLNFTSANYFVDFKARYTGNSVEGILTYRDGDGKTVTKTMRDNTNITVPLELGDNQMTLRVLPPEGSSATPTTYTLNIKRIFDDRVTYVADLMCLDYSAYNAEADIPDTKLSEDYLEKGIIIYNDEDYTSDEIGKSYIQVGYHVDELLFGLRFNIPTTTIPGYNYNSYLTIATATANGIPFVADDSDSRFTGPNSTMSNSNHKTTEPIKLDVGVNEIVVHVDAGGDKPTSRRDYTIYVTRLPDVSLESVTVTDGRLETGGFQPGVEKIKVATDGSAQGRFKAAFTATEGAVITRDVPATAENVQTLGQDAIDKLTITPGAPYAFDAPEPIISSSTTETPKEYPIYVTKTVDDQEVVTRYTLTAYRASDTTTGETLAFSPSSGDEISMPGNFKDSDSNPDGVFRALTGEYKTQLGVFGGFAEYKLDKPIENDPNNKYGVDFIIYGDVTGKTTAAPSVVQVARDEDGDGKPDEWYTLAGSEYYTENTVHDLTVTYTQVSSNLRYADSTGMLNGTISGCYHPLAMMGERFNAVIQNDDSTTYTGELVTVQNPAFGYANVHPRGQDNARPTAPSKPANPYRQGDTYNNPKGDGFDLSWAVDENGLPVSLDSVDFIRVTSATLNSSQKTGATITSIVDVTGESKNAGVSSELQGLKVNGVDISLQEGEYTYIHTLSGAQNVTLSAMTAGANFYVNGESLANEVDSKPIAFDGKNACIVRLIIQSEEKAPKIYHLILVPEIQVNKVSLDKTSVAMCVGEKVKLNAIITPASANASIAVNWFSTAPAVAKVSNGVVTAVGEGTATISAQIGGKMAQCTVTVGYAGVSEVIAAIAILPDTITSADREAIERARGLYDSLTGGEKGKVTNYEKLVTAEAALSALPKPEASVNEVIDLIDYLPRTIGIYDEQDIAAARQAYNALSPELKAQVTNYSKLLDAERALEELGIGEIRYERVVGKIGLIPEVITSEADIWIKDAREAYDLLTDVQKMYVTNYQDLVLAESQYKKAMLDNNSDISRVNELLDKLVKPVSISQKADVLKARRLYDELPDDKKALVIQVNRLAQAEQQLGLASGTSVYTRIETVKRYLTMLPTPLTYSRSQSVGDQQLIYQINNELKAISQEDIDLYLSEEIQKIDEAKATLLTNAIDDLDDIKENFKIRLDEFPTNYIYLDYWNALGLYFLVYGPNPNDKVLKPWYDSGMEEADKKKLDEVVTVCYATYDNNNNKAATLEPYVNAVSALGTLDVKNAEHRAAIEALLTAYTYLESAQSNFKTNHPDQYAVYESALQAMNAYWYKADGVKNGIDLLPAVIGIEVRTQIEKLRSDYNALPEELQALVTNLDKLVQAETCLEQVLEDYDGQIDHVNDLIGAIPDEVVLETEDLIAQAEEAYLALYLTQRASVTGYSKLVSARIAFDRIAYTAARVQNVIDLVNEVGTPVELTDNDFIRAARAAYNALSETEKTAVGQDTYEKLTAAELALATMLPGSEIDPEKIQNVISLINNIPEDAKYIDAAVLAARAAYDALNSSEKQHVTNYNKLLTAEQNGSEGEENQAAADEVIALINEIPADAVKTDETVLAARAAYDALTEVQKALVTNYSKLTQAEAREPGDEVNMEYVQNVIDFIDSIPDGARYNDDAVILARQAYENLNSAEKELVTNYSDLLLAEQNGLAEDQAAAAAVIALINEIEDGATKTDSTVTAARAAYDELTDVQKALVTNYSKLTEAEANESGGETIEVTFRLIGDSKHGTPANDPESLEYHVAYELWIPTTSHTLPEGSTVYDLFVMALDQAGLDFVARDGLVDENGHQIPNNYIEGIESPITGEMLSEFDNGRWSGWMYMVNGEHPGVGLSEKTLNNGDKVVWHYVDNFHIELDHTALTAVIAMIDALPDVVQLSDKSAVQAARAAYEDLTELQQLLVPEDTLNKLMAAEDRIEQLESEPGDPAVDEVLSGVLTYIHERVEDPTVGSTYGEWAVLALARAGIEDDDWYDAYRDNLKRSVAEEVYFLDPETGKVVLHKHKYTENERVILALTALGEDAEDFDGYDFVSALTDRQASPNEDQYQAVWQGINGAIYALIALDTDNYLSDRPEVRAYFLNYLTEQEKTNGGWSLSGGPDSAPDPDITGMALQALAPYYKMSETEYSDLADAGAPSHSAIAASVEEAVETLASMQSESGGFTSSMSSDESSESAAQVLTAFVSLDYDGTEDGSFIESVLENLLTYRDTATGGFKHVLSENVNQMATEQAAYALVAYARYADGANTLYDMRSAFDWSLSYTPPTVDKTALNAEIERANGLDESDYTAGSWAAFQTALAAAELVADSSTATQAEVDSAAAALTAAIDALDEGGSGPPPADRTITVKFRLIGATRSDGDIDLDDGDYKGSEYVTWIKTTSYTLDKGSTVYDLFTEALDEAELKSVGAENNYVKTIYAPSVLGGYKLSEFTNGARSGWMYTVNGIHVRFGLKEQTLHDGDKVVWHYVNDFSYEVKDWFDDDPKFPSLGDGEYYNEWLKAPDVAPGSNSGSSGGGTSGASSDSSTIAPKVTASNGVASASVSASNMTSAIATAKDKDSKAIVIAPDITGTAKKVSVDIPKASLSSVASETEADLKIETPVGHMTIPNNLLSSITSQAAGGSVTVSLEAVNSAALSAAQKEIVGGNPVYDISILSGGSSISGFNGGSVTVSLPYTLKEGEDPSGVTVWYLNDAGELEQMTCTYNRTAGMASFTTTHLSYYVVGYSEDWRNPFTDVKTSDWFYGAVEFAVKNDLFNGTTATAFSPNAQMTRAMLVAVLYRLEGSPAVTGTSGFTDVNKGAWYTDAVIWANANGIVTGLGGGLFGVSDNVTREQLATILYNYAKYKGWDVTKAADLKAFTDASSISGWAQSAMKWSSAEGLVTGVTETTLVPGGSATRAQVATILMRLAEGSVK